MIPPAAPPSTPNPYAPPQAGPPPLRPQPTSDLIAAVNGGVRFVIVPYVCSAVFMTFRRSMGGVQAVSTGHWPLGNAIGATVLTATLGWWGIPWGPLWSIPTLVRLWNGGKDVTLALLEGEVGAQEARRILAGAPRPVKPSAIWLVRLIVLLPLIGFALLLGAIFFADPLPR